jgi:very-short-patch-repair endonuclease
MTKAILDEKLRRWQEDLLDLSGRNRLINCRITKTNSVKIVEPGAREILARLETAEEVKWTILDSEPQATHEVEPDTGPAPQHLANPGTAGAPRPSAGVNQVRAEELDRKLDKVLYRLMLDSRSTFQEQGVQRLYLAIGMLRWQEASSFRDVGSKTPTLSPLLLMPVELKRESGKRPFTVTCRTSEIRINQTLDHKLRTQLGIELLPEATYPDGIVPATDLSGILSNLSGHVAQYAGWSVTTDFVVSRFGFHKYAMYQDLADHAEIAKRHFLIDALATGATLNSSSFPAIPDERDLDDHIVPSETYPILDADASQLRAIQAAVRGGSFIIQGPPGTGKSQTIANIIAECLANGKTVLFVSEKATALEVVRRRLDSAGLSDFVLPLHDHDQTHKRAVLNELSRVYSAPVRLKPGPDPALFPGLASTTKTLRAYASAITQVREPLGLSVYQAIGRIGATNGAATLTTGGLANPAKLEPRILAHAGDLAEDLAVLSALFLEGSQHPWSGYAGGTPTAEEMQILRAALADVTVGIASAMANGEILAAALGRENPATLAELDRLAGIAHHIETASGIPPTWFDPGTARSAHHILAKWQQITKIANDHRRDLDAHFLPTILETDPGLIDNAATRLKAALGSTIDAMSMAGQVLSGWDITAPSLHTLSQKLEEIAHLAGSIASRVGIEPPSTLIDIDRLIALAIAVISSPVDPHPSWWNSAELADLRALNATARDNATTLSTHEDELAKRFRTELVDLATEEFIETYPRGGLFDGLVPSRRQRRAQVRALSLFPQDLTLNDERAALDRARQVATLRSWFTDNGATLTARFGPSYATIASDWTDLADQLERMEALHTNRGTASPKTLRGVVESPSRREGISRDLADLQETLVEFDSARVALRSAAPWIMASRAIARLDSVSPTESADLLSKVLRLGSDLQAGVQRLFAHGLSSHTVDQVPVGVVLSAVRGYQECHAEITAAESDLARLYGRYFNGLETDWTRVGDALAYMHQLIHLAQPQGLTAAMIQRLTIGESATKLVTTATSADQAAARVRRGVSAIEQRLHVDAKITRSATTDALRFDTIATWTAPKAERIGDVANMHALVSVLSDWEASSLASLLPALRTSGIAPEAWKTAVQNRLYTAWVDAIVPTDPDLRAFRGETHASLVERFRRYEREHIKAGPARAQMAIAARHQERISPTAESTYLIRQVNKKSRIPEVRALFSNMPHLVAQLKPCIMTSPLTVSLMLKADSFSFDVVIFDEASQVRPQDAIGAIMRGRQVIIVGDSKQLPPTDFFNVGIDDSEADDETQTTDDSRQYESILDFAAIAGLPQFQLLWHYRSKHEDLIAFSNRHFYDGSLITFPSSDVASSDKGVRFFHVPDGVYHRSGTRTNEVEARRVVDLVRHHVRNHPDRTLLVVTLSSSQQKSVQDAFDRALELHPDLQTFVTNHGHEPFDIKALERVQGDERDTVILSTGYGRDENGKFFQNFGPLTQTGGDRRLNVAITRARQQLVVVSSMNEALLDTSGTNSRGVALLKQFLEFAEYGRDRLLRVGSESGDADSGFEEWVGRSLRLAGYDIRRQVGASKYRIDIGVVHPDAPHLYLAAIECDGSIYHSSKTARERDRLRQEVLEGLGWQVLRVWSTDWYRDPVSESRRLIDALDGLRKARPVAATPPKPAVPRQAELGMTAPKVGPVPTPSSTPTRSTLPRPQTPAKPAPVDTRPPSSSPAPQKSGSTSLTLAPYRPAKLGNYKERFGVLDKALVSKVAEAFRTCVEFESPVHKTVARRRVAAAWSIARTTPEMDARLELGLKRALADGAFEERGGFLWTVKSRPVTVRGPEDGGKSRSIEEIAKEEIAVAASIVLGDGAARTLDRLVAEISVLFGHPDTTASEHDHISDGVRIGVVSGSIHDRNGRLSKA